MKERITDKQGICVVILFELGTNIILGIGGGAKQDAWLVVILASICIMPVLLIYAALLTLYPDMDLFDILQLLFGSMIGKFLSLLYIFFSIYLASLVILTYWEFTNTAVFPDTPIMIPIIIFISVSILAVKAGLEVICRCSEFLVLVVFSAILVVTIVLSAYLVDFKNLLPILENGIKPVIRGIFVTALFPFADVVIFLMAFDSFTNRNSPFRILFVSLIFSAVIFTILAVRNISVIGVELIQSNYFPSYMAVSVIRLGEFIQRLESAVFAVFLITLFIKVSICILAACKGIAKLANTKSYKFFVSPTAFLCAAMSLIFFENTMEHKKWSISLTASYFTAVFQVILPIIIFIFARIKHSKEVKAESKL